MLCQHIFVVVVLFAISIHSVTGKIKSVKVQPTVRLMNAAHGDVLIPVVGLGTGGYSKPDEKSGEYWGPEQGHNATLVWLLLGGRRIDSSHSYSSSPGVGTGWVASGVPRSEIFITTKTEISTYNDTLDQFDAALKGLQTTYVDLLLIHWPGAFISPGQPVPSCKEGQSTWRECRVQSWRALETIFKQGRARAIGVSNFEVNHLLDILNLNSSIPSVNQVEFHPYWHEDDLVDFNHKNNITFNSYSPVGCADHAVTLDPIWNPIPDVRKHPAITAIATKYNKSPAQVILRWHLQQGNIINPRTRSLGHMAENLSLFDFELSDDDMMILSYLNHPISKICPDPRLLL